MTQPRAEFDCHIGSDTEVMPRVIQNGTQLVMMINAISTFHIQGGDKLIGCENCVNEMKHLQRRAIIEAERLGLIKVGDYDGGE